MVIKKATHSGHVHKWGVIYRARRNSTYSSDMHRKISPIKIYRGGPFFVKTGNQAARAMVTKPFRTKRPNLINLGHHFLQEHIPRGHINVLYALVTE